MSLIHPLQANELYPIGSIVQAFVSPGDNWLECRGQVIAQADYPELYAMMDEPHPIFENWEVFDNGLDNYIGVMNGITYGNSRWVAGLDGAVAYSTDGMSWTVGATFAHGRGVTKPAWNGSIFVVTEDYYTAANWYATSSDGMSWTERTFTQTAEWTVDPIWDGTYFYLIAGDDTYCQYSSDGTTWNAGTAMTDGYWLSAACSPDVLIASWGTKFAISTDSMTTWNYYHSPTYAYSIEYLSSEDIFLASFGEYNCYGISAGDDGIDWEIRELPFMQDGQQFGISIYNGDFKRIVKLGSYYIVVPWYSHVGFYSTDLRSWTPFPMPYGEWHDAFYNSSTGYYYMYGIDATGIRWKEVDEYNTSTHFKLPYGSTHGDYNWEIKPKSYIRVK